MNSEPFLLIVAPLILFVFGVSIIPKLFNYKNKSLNKS